MTEILRTVGPTIWVLLLVTELGVLTVITIIKVVASVVAIVRVLLLGQEKLVEMRCVWLWVSLVIVLGKSVYEGCKKLLLVWWHEALSSLLGTLLHHAHVRWLLLAWGIIKASHLRHSTPWRHKSTGLLLRHTLGERLLLWLLRIRPWKQISDKIAQVWILLLLLAWVHPWYLLHLIGYDNMRCANSNSLDREIWLSTLYLGIMVRYKLLDDLIWGILELFIGFGDGLLNFLQAIHSNVLISIRLEYFSRNFSPFEPLSVNEMTVFASSATLRTMVIATGNCSKVARLDQLVHVHNRLLIGHLVDLHHLCFTLLVDLLVLVDCFCCQVDQHIGRLLFSFQKKTAYALLLIYKNWQRGWDIIQLASGRVESKQQDL